MAASSFLLTAATTTAASTLSPPPSTNDAAAPAFLDASTASSYGVSARKPRRPSGRGGAGTSVHATAVRRGREGEGGAVRAGWDGRSPCVTPALRMP